MIDGIFSERPRGGHTATGCSTQANHKAYECWIPSANVNQPYVLRHTASARLLDKRYHNKARVRQL